MNPLNLEQKVLKAFWNAPVSPSRNHQIAAALLTILDEIVPEDFDYWHGSCGDYYNGYEAGQNDRNDTIRSAFLDVIETLTNAPESIR